MGMEPNCVYLFYFRYMYSLPSQCFLKIALVFCVDSHGFCYLHVLFQIKHNSPPLEDIPEFLPYGVRDLIVAGWTVDPYARPTANQLLKHEAFKLLGLSKFSTHPKWLDVDVNLRIN